MKRIVTSILALSTTFLVGAQMQIGNSNFEAWENVTGGEEPVNWNSFLTASGGLTQFAAKQLESSTDKRPGSTGEKSAKIWSRKVMGIIANGNLTLGQLNMGSTTATDPENYNTSVINNPNFSEIMTDRPDSIVFWAKFVPAGNHSQPARMKATIHNANNYRDPEDANSANYIVATAVENFTNTNGWKRFAVPFTYSGPATTPEYILVTFTTNMTPGGGAENDQLFIDDVQLIYAPKPNFTANKTTICTGETVTFTNTSTQFPTSYLWEFTGANIATSTDVNPTVTFTTAGTQTVKLTATNDFGSVTKTMTNYIAVNAIPDANFSYGVTSICNNLDNIVPTKNAVGTFTASPSTLTFANATSGEINLAATAAGTYTITHTPISTCGSPATQTITVLQGNDATFNFNPNTICTLEGDATPTVVNPGGTFTSTAGLDIDAITGKITVENSTAGTYDVTYIISAGCPDTLVRTITLTAEPNASFAYNSAAFCANIANQAPVFPNGANAGVFTSTTGLIIDANTGIINVANSTPGTYQVINTIDAIGACPSDADTTEITINELPEVSLVLPQDTLCTGAPTFMLNGGSPAGGTYSGIGVAGPYFNPNAIGQGDVSYITYTYTDNATSCTNSASALIAIDACLYVDEAMMNNIAVYPNPVNSTLTISDVPADATYTIVSLTGQIVDRAEIAAGTTTIDVTALNNGVYLLQVQVGQATQTLRVIKQ